MRVTFPELPDWSFENTEVSPGVYRASGRDISGRSVERTGTDDVLAWCRQAVGELLSVRPLERGPSQSSDCVVRMQLDLAFFDGDTLVARTAVKLGDIRRTEVVVANGHEFEIHHAYQRPTSPVDITCRKDGRQLYRAALQVAVHNSDDWESIELGSIHTLGFRCSGVSAV